MEQSAATGAIVYGVCVSGWVSAALRIESLGGKASRLHGHDYRVVVCAEGETLRGGILIDHDELQGALDECIAGVDYSVVNDVVGTSNASAEVLAAHIFECLSKRYQGMPIAEIVMVAVCTPRGRCSYVRTGKAHKRL